MKITRLSAKGLSEKATNPTAMIFLQRLAAAGYIKWVPEGNSNLHEEIGGSNWNLVFLGYVQKGNSSQYSYRMKLMAGINLSTGIYSFLNVEVSAAGKAPPFVIWNTTDDNLIKSGQFDNFLKNRTGLSNLKLYHKQIEEISMQKSIQESREKARQEALNIKFRMTRRANETSEARAVIIIVKPTFEGGHEIGFEMEYPESGKKDSYIIWKNSNEDGTALTKQQAQELFDKLVLQLRGARYVDESASLDYIPPEANKSNWDFGWNKWKEGVGPKKETNIQSEIITPDVKDVDVIGSANSMIKEGQDYNFEGFFSGDVPDHAINYLGTPSVEASQIKSMFGKAGDAIDLVNQFNSSLLMNISFIFNFGKSGAYGVYLSELDRAIKTKALKKKLEQKGYTINTTEKGLTAFPKEGQEISNEQVQGDINSIYQDLQSKGGTAIGVNVNAVLSASKSDAAESGSKDPGVWEWMAVLHLGGTIVHEATHAKGSRDEASPESAESTFIQWALPKINEKYRQSLISQGKEDEYSPLTITTNKRHAAPKSWYKQAQAQLSYYIPESLQLKPHGSDLKGRFPYDPEHNEGLGDWSKIAQFYQNIAIELRLGRQFMSPLPKDLNQEHDSIEEQLRKYTRQDQKLDPHATTEELLSEGHDKNRGYTTLEGLLDEKRPKPIIVPLKKNASVIKTATLFGWMNNLDLDDGSTIPGLSDRVMEWSDRDESFVEEEDWIRNQPRYNPEYDLKGFYYRWIEPRYKPQLYDDMTQEYSNTHPAKRFGCSNSVHGEWSKILSILSKAKQGVLAKKLCTRFVITEDLMALIDHIFNDGKIKIHVFEIKDSPESNKLFSVWVTHPETAEDKIEKSERYVQKVEEGDDSLLGELLGSASDKRAASDEVIKQANIICGDYDFQDIKNFEHNGHLYFEGGPIHHAYIVGETLADKLNVDQVEVDSKKMNLAFNYHGVQVIFRNSKEKS